MNMLLLPYTANILILAPIAVPTVFGLFPTDQGCFGESAGWRVLVGSLWLGILVLSVLGLLNPVRYSPVLLLQVIYKSVWLAVYVAPRLRRGDLQSIPRGIAFSFAAIVIIWPFLIPWNYLLGVSR